MDWDDRAELAHKSQSDNWFTKFRSRFPSIADWVSSFRRSGVKCKFNGFVYGSFNWGCRIRFEDGVEWLLRFPVPGKVMDVDEKLHREVAVMRLVREKTNIPVPAVHAWGLSNSNTLGLGPFIIMDYIQGGQCLGHLWRVSNDERILRSDISETDLRTVYRQIASFYLELSKLEFCHVGSLAIRDDQSAQVDLSPLTLKMQEIEAHGGIKVGGSRSTIFSSAEEYFNYVTEQDMEHLYKQPTSVDNADDARAKYKFRHQLNALVSRFVAKEHNQSHARLVCDDFRYGNMIVNDEKELKIIAVVDWEWAYVAPYQMFCSAPRWLLIKDPISWATPNGPEFDRYNLCLELFLNELEYQVNEGNQDGSQPKLRDKLSDQMRRSLKDGKFWFHELIYDCFTAAENSAWKAICDLHPDFEELASVAEEALDEFVRRKMRDLAAYKAEWNAIEAGNLPAIG